MLKPYIVVYERREDDDKWEHCWLDFETLELAKDFVTALVCDKYPDDYRSITLTRII